MTARVSKASPKLLDAMAKGTHLADAVPYLRKRANLKAGAEFMQIRLKNVMVSSYQVTPGDADGGFLVEEVTFAFDEGGMDYRRVRPDGTLARAVQFKGGFHGAISICGARVLPTGGRLPSLSFRRSRRARRKR